MKKLQLKLDITDEQYVKLLELARLTGKSVETTAAAVLLDGFTPRLKAFISLSRKEDAICRVR